jgi:hypothetical protein
MLCNMLPLHEQERAPSPTFSPPSGKSFPWDGGVKSFEITVRNPLPDVELMYSRDGSSWSPCQDSSTDDVGEEGVECKVSVPQTCSTTSEVQIDEEGFSQCCVSVWARASGTDMAESLPVEATYTLHIPPPLGTPVFSPSSTEDQVIEAGPDAAMDVDITCPLGALPHFTLIPGSTPTGLSPLFTSGALQLGAGLHTVTAICYLPSRKQSSDPVSITYTVIGRAPAVLAQPPSGTPLAGDGGTVSVILSAPLAGAAISFTVNDGATSVCGSGEVCQVLLPVTCAEQDRVEQGGTEEEEEEEEEASSMRRLLSRTPPAAQLEDSRAGREGTHQDVQERPGTQELAEDQAPLCRYRIVAEAQAEGYAPSHAEMFVYTVADTSSINGYVSGRLGGRGSRVAVGTGVCVCVRICVCL